MLDAKYANSEAQAEAKTRGNLHASYLDDLEGGHEEAPYHGGPCCPGATDLSVLKNK